MSQTPTKAQQFFDIYEHWLTAESDMGDVLLASIGRGDSATDPEEVLKDITYDWYDYSFEFKGVRQGWEPTPEMQSAWWEIGFSRCWICYADGTEKHYAAPLKTTLPAPPVDATGVK